MSCTRFVLHGSYDDETEKARVIMDESKIPYRLERAPRENYDGLLTLCTPAGRFVGLKEINFMFGREAFRRDSRLQPVEGREVGNA